MCVFRGKGQILQKPEGFVLSFFRELLYPPSEGTHQLGRHENAKAGDY